jgi:hypothetical protein
MWPASYIVSIGATILIALAFAVYLYWSEKKKKTGVAHRTRKQPSK